MIEGLEQFDAIRPYEPEEMKQAFEELLSDRQFNLIMKGLHGREVASGFPDAFYEACG